MKSYDELLKLLIDRQLNQDEEFHTTNFWEFATNQLTAVLEKNEIHRFRNDSACLSYFVPTYGYPGLGLSAEQTDEINKISSSGSLKQQRIISNFVSGQSQAVADYRAIKACTMALGFNPFKNFNESEVGQPIEQFIFSGKRYSRPTHNYMLGLLFLLSHQYNATLNSVVEIGGGHGALGEILFKSDLGVEQYINFDIPPTCIFAEYYLNQIFPNKFNSDLSDPWHESVEINDLTGLHVRPNWDIKNLNGSIDLFVNYHSFQEMEPFVVQRYVNEIFRLKPRYLLLRNIREGKQQKTIGHAGVKEPIKATDYESWLQPLYQLIASDSQIFGFITADGFHSELSLWKLKQ